MAQGIILAAGYSSRAKTNKMLLTHDDRFLLSHAIESMTPHVKEIFVVTGHYHDEIVEAVKVYHNVQVIFNPIFDQGMFTSVQAGAKATSDDFFILPGDCPLVSASTYRMLLGGSKTIRVPSYRNRNGHPIFFASSLKEELVSEPPTSNLKAFRNRHDYEIIKTEDPGILLDIDTPADYRTLEKKYGKDAKHGS